VLITRARTGEESSSVIKRTGIALALLCTLGPAGAAQAADIVGRASFGVSGGAMTFLSGSDYSAGGLKRTRPVGQFVFKYNFSSKLAGVLESGYGWNSYGDVDLNTDTLAVVIPTTIGLEYRFRAGESKLWPHAAVGGGIYSLGIKDSYRTWAEAGDGTDRLTWSSPGMYGKLGTEYLFDDGVSLNFDFLFHAIFSKDDKYTFTPVDPGDPNYDPNEEAARARYSNTWGVQNTSFAEFRIGVNYYFTIKKTSAAPPSGE
jgi:hypothetical protein